MFRWCQLANYCILVKAIWTWGIGVFPYLVLKYCKCRADLKSQSLRISTNQPLVSWFYWFQPVSTKNWGRCHHFFHFLRDISSRKVQLCKATCQWHRGVYGGCGYNLQRLQWGKKSMGIPRGIFSTYFFEHVSPSCLFLTSELTEISEISKVPLEIEITVLRKARKLCHAV